MTALSCAPVLALAGVVALAAQTPPGREAADLRAQAALQALDRYLESWNSRDPARWAASLHFPHVRPGPGAFERSTTPEQYAAGVNFSQTLATGWHHSEWTSRRVLHVGADKVHVAGAWQRYTAEDRPLTGSVITYIVTSQNGRWGVLSRFAAGATGLEGDAATAATSAARAALAAYLRAWNSHDPNALSRTLHFPYVRIDGAGTIEMASSAAEFLAGSEPGRQRTWYETRLDHSEVVQVSVNGVNIAMTYSRRDRSGQVLSQYDAVVLVVGRADGWKIQALSTLGT